MFRLLTLALLLSPVAQAQSPADCAGEPTDFRRAVDAEAFEVWGSLAGFEDGSLPVCTVEEEPRGEDDAPDLFYAVDADGQLLLDAVVERDGRPLPFAIVTATTREERDGRTRLAAVGVADREGAITMVVPASRHAVRLTISAGGDGPPDVESLRVLGAESDPGDTSFFVRQSGDFVDLLVASVPEAASDAAGSYALRRYRNKHKKVQLTKQLRSRKHFT